MCIRFPSVKIFVQLLSLFDARLVLHVYFIIFNSIDLTS